jgi:hypothetical protein
MLIASRKVGYLARTGHSICLRFAVAHCMGNEISRSGLKGSVGRTRNHSLALHLAK